MNRCLIALYRMLSRNIDQAAGLTSGSDILRGPVWDHTLCAMLNDLRVGLQRHAAPSQARVTAGGLGRRVYRYFLGVKWSQVQILSARPE